MTARYDRFSIDGITPPRRLLRMHIPTDEQPIVSPAIWKGVVIGLAIVLPAWLMYWAAVLRFGFGT